MYAMYIHNLGLCFESHPACDCMNHTRDAHYDSRFSGRLMGYITTSQCSHSCEHACTCRCVLVFMKMVMHVAASAVLCLHLCKDVMALG